MSTSTVQFFGSANSLLCVFFDFVLVGNRQTSCSKLQQGCRDSGGVWGMCDEDWLLWSNWFI